MKSFAKIIRLMFSSGKKTLLEAFFILLLLLAFETSIPIGINYVISVLEEEKNVFILLIGVVVFVFAYIFVSLFSALNTKMYIRIGNSLLWNMREEIYKVIWKADYFENVQKNKDKYKFVLSNQTYTAFAIAVVYSLGGITNVLTACVFLLVVFIYSVPAGITLIICIAVSLLISFLTGKSILNGFEAFTKAQEKDTAQIYETVDLIEATRTNGLEEYYLKKNKQIHNEFMKLSERTESRSSFCEAIENGINSLIYIIVSGIFLLTGEASGGEIVTILFVTNLTLDISHRIQRQLQVIIKNIPVFNNVVEVMETPLKGGKEIGDINNIEIENLSFEIEERKVFSDVNASIKKGDNVLISGANGSGKSSLLKMLLGLYSPTAGSIKLNGEDISVYDSNLLFNEICYISQEELMLNETVEEYLKAVSHSDRSAEYIKELCNKVNLNKEIEVIEENGTTLSGGEKKKLFMVKCLLKNKASVVILDEIDAGVDAETKVIWKKIENELLNDRTKIVFKISHIDNDTEGINKFIKM